MVKIALVTKYSSYNYGAMLQTYALQKTVNDLGANCEIVDSDRVKSPSLQPWRTPGQILNNIFFLKYKKELQKGYSCFDKFIESYNLTRQYVNYDELCDNPPAADIYLTGSDQVWNPLKITDSYFLRFAPKQAVRASYAASMGVSYIPSACRKIFSEYINGMDYISVRENDAKDMINDLTGEIAEVHVDPVLLLDKNEWNEFSIKPQVKNPYILCYILYRPQWINSWLKQLRKKTGKQIVVISSSAYRNIYHNKMVRDAGPKEMLGWIQNADFVISSSFHGVALSIANHKPFYAVINPNSPSRISNLLKIFNLSKRIITEKSEFELKGIDFEAVEQIRVAERSKAIDYLKFLISNPQKKDKQERREINELKGTVENIGDKCTACTICENICPVSAIKLEENCEGFKYPRIDKSKCISCGRCLKKCHVVDGTKNSKESCKVYYGWNKDANIRALSTSGGAFSVFADFVLKQKGVVIGAYFDSHTKKVVHESTNKVDVGKMRRSKYVESDMLDSIKKIDMNLKAGKYVLFCGTPCQCAGVRKRFGYLEKLILCDFFCHGVPSPRVFKEFLEYKECKKSDKIKDYQFRTKDFGWSQYGHSIIYESGKNVKTVGRCEFFYTATMLDNLFLRKSCYTCNKNIYHMSDFTIGDFWGVNNCDSNLNDNKGISIIITNTELGEKLLDEVKDAIEIYPLEKHYVDYAFRVKTADKQIEKRDIAFAEYNKIGIREYIRKYYKKRLWVKNVLFVLKKKKYERLE